MFADRRDDCLKILLTTRFSDERLRNLGNTKLTHSTIGSAATGSQPSHAAAAAK